MLRGLYTAASGMQAQQRFHDTVTNNITNLNTPGFKASAVVNRSFPNMLISAMGGPNQSSDKVGRLSTGVFAEENLMLMTQGDLKQTHRYQDMALVSDVLVPGAVFDGSGKYVDPNGQVTYQPQAYFSVLTPQGGEQYTRDGSFKTASDGTLVTSEGFPVLGADGQPIITNVAWDNITVAANGSLVDASTGEAIDGNPQLRLMLVNNPNELLRSGDGLFSYTGEAAGIRQVDANDRVEVKQGFLEGSNVNAAQSAVDIMSALRAYEANQKVIQFYDRSLDKAVNEVGKV
ncbi:MAG: flagellar hook-basal body protein [Candidatus Cohnella colombiensis]|uniref:Flagellar hook-basal body protein n=1 Tax=Candidatus Cohnella colombiensis TaxID=3121368 RepID=A0AA95EW31_9BACL|nr:MAG: flagellar hook-basal body protein [Cohnella sp.]